MAPDYDKMRQANINRAMHADQTDRKEKDGEKPLEPSNSVVVKKERRWHKIRDNIKRKVFKKTS